jgi:hypothetical protein
MTSGSSTWRLNAASSALPGTKVVEGASSSSGPTFCGKERQQVMGLYLCQAVLEMGFELERGIARTARNESCQKATAPAVVQSFAVKSGSTSEL